jgi:hypothetical protein
MGHASINGKPVAPQRSPQIISRSAILILSGVLIGNALHQGPLDGLSFYGFCAGIMGIISFLGLDLVARRGRQRVVRKTLAAVDLMLSKRLRRQIECHGPTAPARRRRWLPIAESSYLTVTSAWK